MNREKWHHREKVDSMESTETERDSEISQPLTSDARDTRRMAATISDISPTNALLKDTLGSSALLHQQPDSSTTLLPSYTTKTDRYSRELPIIQFRDLSKPMRLSHSYWTCISPNRYGQQCRISIPWKNIVHAKQEIKRLLADFPDDIPSEPELVKVSKVLLCQRYHQSQAAKFAVAWKDELLVSSQDTTSVDRDVTQTKSRDRFLQFPSRQPSSIISAIVREMRFSVSNARLTRGSIYMVNNPRTPSMIKIGFTCRDVLRRLQEISRSCHFNLVLISQHFTHCCQRTEKLIHHSLWEYGRVEMECNAGDGCKCSHSYWFEIDGKHAILTTERWIRWMSLNPYVSNELDAFWHINLLEAEQLPNLDAFHQWIDHMIQKCIENGEDSWRGRTDGRFWNINEQAAIDDAANEAQMSHISSSASTGLAETMSIASETSIASTDTPSLTSGTTLSSTLPDDQLATAVDRFVTWLLQDELIQHSRVIAIHRIGADRFERKFRRLLKEYSNDLKAEAQTSSELQAAQFIRTRRTNVARRFWSQLNSLTSEEESRQFQTLSTQKADKEEVMLRFGLAINPLDKGIVDREIANFESRLNEIWADDIELDNVRLDDFILDEFERDESAKSEADIPSLPNLGMVKEFMITSESFTRLRQNMKDSILPPRQHTLQDSVAMETQKSNLIADLSPTPNKESAEKTTETRLSNRLKDSSSLFASKAMSYVRDHISPTKPLATGQVRLNWECTCGHRSYDDFQELRPGAVREYAQKLLQSGYVTSAQPTTYESGAGATLLTAARNQVAAARRNMPTWKRNKTGQISKPKSRKFALLQCSPSPGITCRWLHLCLKRRPNAKAIKLEPLHVCKDDTGSDLTDEGLFKLLRTAWRVQRSWVDLRLFKLARIEFIKFSAVPDDSVDGIVRGIVPPTTNHYDFTPPPPLEQVPIHAEHFVHLLEAECSPNSQKGLFYLSQLPKKKDKPLKFSPSLVNLDANVGYGLRFVEKPDQSIVATFLFLITVLVGTSFGVSWTIFKHDLQGAWAISAYFVSVMALAMVTLQTRLTS